MNKLSKIFKAKGIGFILLAFAAGIVLLLLPENSESQEANSSPSVEYVSTLEASLESILKDICGAECKAMITLETGYSYTYASNEKLETEYQNEVTISKIVSKEYRDLHFLTYYAIIWCCYPACAGDEINGVFLKMSQKRTKFLKHLN